MTGKLTRRQALAGSAAALLSSSALRSLLADDSRAFRIGACDWSIGKRQQIAAFEVAEQIGLDGVEVTFDGAAEDGLRNEQVQQAYLAEAKRRGLEICSMAIGTLNQIPYSSDPRAETWVEESIDVMTALRVRVTLVPFFLRGDIKGNEALQATVIERLKKVAPKAEKAGVILGLETTLSADEHLRILNAVGSPAVKIYYDVSNSLRYGYDIYEEIPRLAGNIARFHMKEKTCLLGDGQVDFNKVRDALEKINYRDWLVIEAATVKGRPLIDCHRHNLALLRGLFPKA